MIGWQLQVDRHNSRAARIVTIIYDCYYYLRLLCCWPGLNLKRQAKTTIYYLPTVISFCLGWPAFQRTVHPYSGFWSSGNHAPRPTPLRLLFLAGIHHRCNLNDPSSPAFQLTTTRLGIDAPDAKSLNIEHLPRSLLFPLLAGVSAGLPYPCLTAHEPAIHLAPAGQRPAYVCAKSV